jgi:hypothetical protein
MACAAAPARAQAPNPRSLLLTLPPTVRSAALNGAATALVGDAGAVFANPAGLATVRHIAVEGAYRTLPTAEAFVGTAALGWRLRQFDLGFGMRYADLGVEPEAYLGPAVAGGEVDEVLGVGSLVYRRGILALGATGKQLRRRADGQDERGRSMDAGFALAFFDILALAFSMQNIGGNWDETSTIAMPGLKRFGFTMNYVDPQESFRLLSVLEVQWPEDEGSRLVLGAEGGVVLEGVGVVGRIGYGSRRLLGGSEADVTYGTTLELPGIRVDYAYRGDDVLGRPAHQFGVRIRL